MVWMRYGREYLFCIANDELNKFVVSPTDFSSVFDYLLFRVQCGQAPGRVFIICEKEKSKSEVFEYLFKVYVFSIHINKHWSRINVEISYVLIEGGTKQGNLRSDRVI